MALEFTDCLGTNILWETNDFNVLELVPVILFLSLYPKERLDSRVAKRQLYSCVHSSVIYNSQQVDIALTHQWKKG